MLAQLVGLPDEIDRLGEGAVLLRPGGGAGRRGRGEHIGDAPQLGQDRPAARLGGMRGEHRAYSERCHRARQPGAAQLGGYRRDRAGQPSRVRRALAQAAHAMHLLGDVGQVEISRECAHQRRRRVDRQSGEQVANLVARRVPRLGGRRLLAQLRQRADPFDEVEQRLTLLPHKGFAQQHAHPAHVCAQRRVVRLGGQVVDVGQRRHAAGVSHAVNSSAESMLTWMRVMRDGVACAERSTGMGRQAIECLVIRPSGPAKIDTDCDRPFAHVTQLLNSAANFTSAALLAFHCGTTRAINVESVSGWGATRLNLVPIVDRDRGTSCGSHHPHDVTSGNFVLRGGRTHARGIRMSVPARGFSGSPVVWTSVRVGVVVRPSFGDCPSGMACTSRLATRGTRRWA